MLRAGGLERLAQRLQLGQEPEVPALGGGGRQLPLHLVEMVLGLGALALAQFGAAQAISVKVSVYQMK